MQAGATVRDARLRAGLTQAELARRAGTSQVTVSAYERDRKRPSRATLGRLVGACGVQLRVDEAPFPVRRPSAAELERAGRILTEVIAVAALLPTRHDQVLRYPRLPVTSPCAGGALAQTPGDAACPHDQNRLDR